MMNALRLLKDYEYAEQKYKTFQYGEVFFLLDFVSWASCFINWRIIMRIE